MNRLSIVLDMDGTLVGPEANPRPHLQSFLQFCFETCYCVGIWTYASREWFDEVNRKTFEPILAEISCRLAKRCQFDFVYTRERCVEGWTHTASSFYYGDTTRSVYKPLKKIWKRKSGVFANLSPHNVVVVDDNAQTFARNYGNGIQVPGFVFDDDRDVLLHLQTFLKFLQTVLESRKTVRNTEKRDWYVRSASSGTIVPAPL